jgi:hypothetical protein
VEQLKTPKQKTLLKQLQKLTKQKKIPCAPSAEKIIMLFLLLLN